MASRNTLKTAVGSAFLLLPWALQLANAQQFDNFKTPYEQLGLSKACTDVLNTTVSCDSALASVTEFDRPSVDVLDPDTLGKVCVAKCRDELKSLRTNIASICNKQTDLIVFGKTAYPATFILDHYIYQYDVSCYADKKTGQLCDLYLGNLRNQSKEPDVCSDCILGVYAVQLSSPLGYYDEIAQQFSSIKSKCGTAAATYTYTKTMYSTSSATSKPGTTTSTKASTTTTSKTPAQPTTPPLTCDRKYTVVQNDTCSSIALAQKASTYNIVTLNALSIFCSDLPKPGAQICLPSPCTPYKIVAGDTCTGIANKWSATVDELLAWNPIFSFSCANVDKWWDFIICVGVGNGTSPTTIRTITTSTATTTPKPTISVGPLQPKKPHAPGSQQQRWWYREVVSRHRYSENHVDYEHDKVYYFNYVE
ncbi:hypothetical protein B0T25DRAFT_634368 [Lasiosphaeria hispida]|uniref:LysM domain-containing protein n=1 Tax=Lasiosphaeria hispida TaxID=260671 RepID=A0AAJ0HD39_9PEZI|nr:hypothetical protein B0T25DRAFT_634368 [Lasiosphaeria hispida]